MKKLFTAVHIVLVLVTLLFCTVKGQIKVEVIPYRLIPSNDIHCPIDIEIIEPVT